MSVGKRISQRRKELGISADALGKKLGKDRSTIFRYENGDIEKLPIDILRPIAEALLTTPEYLMGWDEETMASVQKNNSTIADAVVRMRTDEDFASIVSDLMALEPEQLTAVKQLLSAFHK